MNSAGFFLSEKPGALAFFADVPFHRAKVSTHVYCFTPGINPRSAHPSCGNSLRVFAMAVAKKVKVHTSALCWIPPIAQQEAIQALRAEFDRQIDRWPPHVNLLYPFVPVSEFQLAAAMLASALARLPPFSVNMQRLQHFKHSQKSFTAWLDPDGALEQWQALQSCCMAVLPHCVDQTARGAFVPHLTVGQFTGASDVEALRARIEHSFEPLACQVGEIALISRAGQVLPTLAPLWLLG